MRASKNLFFIPFLTAFMVLSTAVGLQSQVRQDSVLQMSLASAREYAITHNKQMTNAYLDIVNAQRKIWETTAMGLPQANATVGHNYNIDLPVTLIPARMFNPNAPEGTYMEMKFGTDHNTKFGLSVTQLIFSGQYIVGLQAARMYKQLSEKNAEKTKIDIEEAVTQAYYMVLMSQEIVSVLDSTYEHTLKIADDTKQLAKTGMVEQTKADQMNLNLLTLENALSSSRNRLQVARRLLKFQMGLSFADSLVLTDKLTDLLKAVDVQQTVSENFSVDNHIQYQLLQTQEQLQRLNLKREKATFLPTLSAFYNHQESMMGNEIKWFDADGKWFPANIVGVNLNIPLFGSGQKIARVAQQKIALEKLQNQESLLQQNLVMQVLQAKSDLQTAYNSLLMQESSRELSKKMLNHAEQRYQAGMISEMEYTQFLTQYFNTLNAYYQATFQVLQAKAKLDKAMNKF
jgi:outer membrane protein TolC